MPTLSNAIELENIAVGKNQSRVSTTIFVMLALMPAFAVMVFGGVDSITWVFLLVFTTAIVLLWLAEGWRAGGVLFRRSGLYWPLVALFTIGLLQLIPLLGPISFDPYSTRFFLSRLGVYIIFFAACLTFINTESRLNRIMTSVVAFGGFIAFVGILQRLATPEGIFGIRETPQAVPFGPFVNQHHFATLMQMTGGCALALLFDRKARRERRILLAAAFIVMAAATIMTSSRGGLLALAGVAAFVTALHFITRKNKGLENRQKLAIAAVAIGLPVLILGLVLFVGGGDALLRGVGAVNPNADVSSGRLHFWSVALRVFMHNPLLGCGFDALAVAFTRHDTWTGILRIDQAHNEYIQMLAEGGLAALACVIAFIYLLFRASLGLIRTSTGPGRYITIGALAGCFGVIVHSLFDFPLRTHANTFVFLLLCAIATVTIEADSQASHRRRRPIAH